MTVEGFAFRGKVFRDQSFELYRDDLLLGRETLGIGAAESLYPLILAHLGEDSLADDVSGSLGLEVDLRANSIRANLLANNLDAVEGWSDVWTGSTWGSLAVVACRDKHCTLERYNDSSCIIRWYDSEGDAVYAYSALKQRTYNWLQAERANGASD